MIEVAVRNIGAVPVESLDITYDGPALAERTMDVRALAPSLLALADAFQVAQAVVDPNAEPPSLNIVASPRAGSFIVELVVNYGLLAQSILTSGPATAAANASGLVAWVETAIGAIKWLRKRPSRIEELPSGTVRYTTADGDTLVVPRESSMILETPKFRAEIGEVVAPLRRPGIRSLQIGTETGRAEPVVIEAEDVQAFELPEVPTDDDVLVNERTVVVNIGSLSFRRDLSWRLSDGASTFTARVDDPEFRAKMHRREVVFAEGDQLRVILRETQERDPVTGKLSTSRSIVRVLEHIPAPVQGELFTRDDN